MSKFCPLCNQVTNCTDNCNSCIQKESAFGSVAIKEKVDAMFKLGSEIMDLSGDIEEYFDDENEVLNEIANFINIYKNVFN